MNILSLPESRIRDNVHGYIHVPKPVLHHIVDTEMFQRLRRIEQTSGSLRSMYPGARHDRFSHSLGVYHLGCKAFDVLYEQYNRGAIPFLPDECSEDWWRKTYLLFTLACLLHDCAHAPFSHAFEGYYDMLRSDAVASDTGESKYSALSYELVKEHSKADAGFEYDFSEMRGIKVCGAPHERASSLAVGRYFALHIDNMLKEINEHNQDFSLEFNEADFAFMTRMIIGCRYQKETSRERCLRNCFIEMLNSLVMDVDKLDYIKRDTVNSGISNWDIDYDRIIGSFEVCTTQQFVNEENLEVLPEHAVWLSGAHFELKGQAYDDNAGVVKLRGRADIGFSNKEDRAAFVDCHRSADSTFETVIVHDDSEVVLCTHEYTGCIIINAKENCTVTLSGSKGKVSGTCLISGRDEMVPLDKDNSIGYTLGYGSGALSVLQNAIDARNMFHLWAYSRPMALYQSDFLLHFIIKMSAHYLCCMKYNKNNLEACADYPLSDCAKCPAKHAKNVSGNPTSETPPSADDIVQEILSIETVLHPERSSFETEGPVYTDPFFFYRSSDEDLVALFRWVQLENDRLPKGVRNESIHEFFGQYFSRPAISLPWKSFADFKRFSQNYPDIDVPSFQKLGGTTSLNKNYYIIVNSRDEGIGDIFEAAGIDIMGPGSSDAGEDIVVTRAKPNVKQIKSSSIIVSFENGMQYLRLSDVKDDAPATPIEEFIFLYAKKHLV